MLKNKKTVKNCIFVLLIILMCGIIFFYQTKKIGFHEDEMYTIASSVNPDNGLMATSYDEKGAPTWITKEYVKNYIKLTTNNILNFKAIYLNQAYDNHPPLFYTLVHFSSLLFLGQFTKYNVFIVNIIAFILSCFIIKKTLKILDKEHLTFPTIILYGFSMGTISMVIFQRMYMLLTFFILLYFYYSLKIYKNNFELSKKDVIKLGIITILGFLTQYYFAVYAFLIFVLMIIKMLRIKKDKNVIKKYIISHIIYAITGVLLFVPCIKHLFFSSRGLTNLGNSNYFEHFATYLKHLAYAFTINNSNIILITIISLIFFILVALCMKKHNTKECTDRFVILISILPSIIYFVITVKMTSFQELRYIMPVIPFICLTLFLVLDNLIKFKYKEYIFIIFAIIVCLNGFIFSKPKFLYEDYKESLNIAEDHKDLPFVYIYDNFFNHMQSIPEMCIYKQTLIINVNNDELKFVFDDDVLKNSDSFILCVKCYIDYESIINDIKNNTDFKNVTTLYNINSSSDVICNNLYLMSK